jgi:hypothetical protein
MAEGERDEIRKGAADGIGEEIVVVIEVSPDEHLISNVEELEILEAKGLIKGPGTHGGRFPDISVVRTASDGKVLERGCCGLAKHGRYLDALAVHGQSLDDTAVDIRNELEDTICDDVLA